MKLALAKCRLLLHCLPMSEGAIAPAVVRPAELLVLEPDGGWMDIPGAIGRFGRKQALKQLLIRSVKAGDLSSDAFVGPQSGTTVYFRSPALGDACYPLAEIHTRLFSSQVSEALRMLQSLGATRIEITAHEGWGRELLTSLDLPLRIGGLTPVAARASHSASSHNAVLVRHRLRPVGSARRLDEAYWLKHHPSWEAIVQGVLQSNLRRCELQISQTTDFGFDANFAAKIEGIGLSLGGEFKEHKRTTWTVSARFKPQRISDPIIDAWEELVSWISRLLTRRNSEAVGHGVSP